MGVRVQLWVWVRSVAVVVSVAAHVPRTCHVGGALVQRVHVLLLKALLQVRHAGVRVLPMVAPSTAASSAPRSPTCAAAAAAAVAGWGRRHALEGLRLWGELGAQGVS